MNQRVAFRYWLATGKLYMTTSDSLIHLFSLHVVAYIMSWWESTHFLNRTSSGSNYALTSNHVWQLSLHCLLWTFTTRKTVYLNSCRFAITNNQSNRFKLYCSSHICSSISLLPWIRLNCDTLYSTLSISGYSVFACPLPDHSYSSQILQNSFSIIPFFVHRQSI